MCNGCLLLMPSHGLWVCVCVLISFYKDTSHLGPGHTHMTSFHFTQPLLKPHSDYGHILRSQGSGGGEGDDKMQPLTSSLQVKLLPAVPEPGVGDEDEVCGGNPTASWLFPHCLFRIPLSQV